MPQNEPTPETVQILCNIKTEIGAGMCLLPKEAAQYAWNNACERALEIITNYEKGQDLFQMTRRAKSRGKSPDATK
jgi:hypothetical protein